jgi:site-specific recombinase XerC
MTEHLDRQLAQLDDLLKLFDTTNLQAAQRAVEHQIAELNERLETTRQALTQAQAQRRRLARARLLLEDAPPEAEPVKAVPVELAPEEAPRPATLSEVRQVVERDAEDPPAGSYLPDRRRNERRRANGNG